MSTSNSGGITATNINAGAIAIGPRARATVHQAGSDQSELLRRALADLRAQLERLSPNAAPIPAQIEKHLQELEETTEAGNASSESVRGPLTKLVESMKSVVDVSNKAADLIEPISKITAAVGLGLTAIGW